LMSRTVREGVMSDMIGQKSEDRSQSTEGSKSK